MIIDDRYKFNVDFYITSLDIFIEINAFWSHGKHLFDENNIEDINLLNEWEEKAKTSSQYKRSIVEWTQRDPLKVKTAEENNLNYIPIWSDKIDIIKQTIETYFNEHNLHLPKPTYNYTEEEIIYYIKTSL